MIHTACGARCNIIRLHLVPQDVSGTGLYPFIRDTIKAAWLIKCPTCGKEVRRKTKTDAIRAAKAEGFAS
jgi:DNA-directed RNA polymerase subunit RPC12/RpoP